MVAPEGEANQIAEAQIAGEQNSPLANGFREDSVVRLASQSDIADVYGVKAGFSQGARQGPR